MTYLFGPVRGYIYLSTYLSIHLSHLVEFRLVFNEGAVREERQELRTKNDPLQVRPVLRSRHAADHLLPGIGFRE